MRQLLKQSLCAIGLHDFLLKDVAVIVALHRVNDQPGADDLTLGVKLFERYCRFFQQHFNVVPLADVVARLEAHRPLNRELAITFDDGYRDNFEHALPILERLSLPATFFLVSQWIGTDVVPWWDRERHVAHAWMTWDQVRTLHRKGHLIGSHTRTHADLGEIGSEAAEEEIRGGRLELEAELANRVEYFAYPYGGRRNLTASNRAVVRAAGFRCCCSGFGGINTNATNTFHLRRVAISPWYESPHSLGFDLAFGRSALPL